MEKTTLSGGAYTALVTPFSRGKVDFAALGDLIEAQIEEGIDGLVPCGTTGESPTLTPKEHLQVIAFTVKKSAGRVPVIAGTGSNATQEAVHYTKEAKKVGADAALLVCPYYNRPSQRGLLAHFQTIADAVALPQILYNIPGRSGVNLLPETLAMLAKHPNIIGVKEASGNLEQMAQIRRLMPEPFLLLSGDDTLTLPILALGGQGVISVVSNLIPGEVAAMVRFYRRGFVEEARRIFEKTGILAKTLMTVDTNPVGVKTALALLGKIREEFRLPLVSADDAGRGKIRNVLQDAGLWAPRKIKRSKKGRK